MPTTTGEVTRPRFIQRLESYILRPHEKLRREQSQLYVEREVIQGSFFSKCSCLADFETKLREATIFLTSETGFDDKRTSSMPNDRVFIHLLGYENLGRIGVPQVFVKLSFLAARENRTFLITDTNGRRMFLSGSGEQDPQGLYTALPETFDLEPADLGSTLAPSILALPLVKSGNIPVGMVVVAGLRKDFLLPHVDLAAIRKLGLHAAEMFKLEWSGTRPINK